MAELLLIRHAQAKVNVGDLGIGNKSSPLTPKGIEQTKALKQLLMSRFGIVAEEYDQPVVASTYRRPFETAYRTGFRTVHRSPIIDESEIYGQGELAGVDIIKKHISEGGWIPQEEQARARQFIDAVQDGSWPYTIVYSHGMVIAAIVSELNRQGAAYPFDPERGYVPLQSGVLALEV